MACNLIVVMNPDGGIHQWKGRGEGEGGRRFGAIDACNDMADAPTRRPPRVSPGNRREKGGDAAPGSHRVFKAVINPKT